MWCSPLEKLSFQVFVDIGGWEIAFQVFGACGKFWEISFKVLGDRGLFGDYLFMYLAPAPVFKYLMLAAVFKYLVIAAWGNLFSGIWCSRLGNFSFFSCIRCSRLVWEISVQVFDARGLVENIFSSIWCSRPVWNISFHVFGIWVLAAWKSLFPCIWWSLLVWKISFLVFGARGPEFSLFSCLWCSRPVSQVFGAHGLFGIFCSFHVFGARGCSQVIVIWCSRPVWKIPFSCIRDMVTILTTSSSFRF